MKEIGEFALKNPKVSFGITVAAIGGLIVLLWGKDYTYDDKGVKTTTVSRHPVHNIKAKGKITITTQTAEGKPSIQSITGLKSDSEIVVTTSEESSGNQQKKPQEKHNSAPLTTQTEEKISLGRKNSGSFLGSLPESSSKVAIMEPTVSLKK